MPDGGYDPLGLLLPPPPVPPDDAVFPGDLGVNKPPAPPPAYIPVGPTTVVNGFGAPGVAIVIPGATTGPGKAGTALPAPPAPGVLPAAPLLGSGVGLQPQLPPAAPAPPPPPPP